MRVFHSIDQLPEFKNTVFTQGTFDGVHLGHQQILAQMTEVAQKTGEKLLFLPSGHTLDFSFFLKIIS